MSSKLTARLAWALCGLTACVAVALFVADLLSPNHSSDLLKLASDALFSLALPVVFAVVAALIVSHQPRNAIGWLLMLPVGLVLVEGPIEQYVGAARGLIQSHD